MRGGLSGSEPRPLATLGLSRLGLLWHIGGAGPAVGADDTILATEGGRPAFTELADMTVPVAQAPVSHEWRAGRVHGR